MAHKGNQRRRPCATNAPDILPTVPSIKTGECQMDMGKSHFDVECTEVVNWIHDGDTISVSDGSFKLLMGTSSWRILNKHQKNCILMGANSVPKRTEDRSSYQSEFAGMFRTIVYVALLVGCYDIKERSIEVA
jgi:hypothetical protein